MKSYPLIIVILFLMTFHFGTYAQNREISLFDGTTLNGWKTVKAENQKLWSVKDGAIVAGDGINKIPENTYLHTIKEYKNFEFRCLFKLTGDESTGMINSGIQYRSVLERGTSVGYQADIGNGYWGDIYDEHRREKLVGADLNTLNYVLRKNDWNSYTIRCIGDHHEIYINGVKTADYTEMDKSISSKGVIAVQIHSGGKAQVAFRNLVIEEL